MSPSKIKEFELEISVAEAFENALISLGLDALANAQAWDLRIDSGVYSPSETIRVRARRRIDPALSLDNDATANPEERVCGTCCHYQPHGRCDLRKTDGNAYNDTCPAWAPKGSNNG